MDRSNYALDVSVEPLCEPVTLKETRLHLRVTDGSELAIDIGAATSLNAGAETGIPIASHGLDTSGGDKVIISGSVRHDGSYTTTSNTTSSVVAINKAYVAETFAGVEYLHHSGAEDSKIFSLITAARKICELYQDRAYITQTLIMYLDYFVPIIRPPRAPIQSVTSLKYYDTAGVQQTLTEDTDFTLDIKSHPGRILPEYSTVWPTVKKIPNTIELTYKAGYGDEKADVPEMVKNAILLLISHWFENREEVVFNMTPSRLPMGVVALLGLESVKPI